MLTEETQKALYQKLGECLRQYRTEAGIKQELLASYVGLNRVSIVNIEKGMQKVQLHTLLEISKYLQVPVEKILAPLNDLIADEVDTKLEKRITKELSTEKSDEISKIKQFVNFARTKNSNK